MAESDSYPGDASSRSWLDSRAVIAILAAGLLLRFWNLDGRSLWLDEAYSVWRASQSAADIWAITSDPHPPLYYLLLHFALSLGRSEAVARAPSAIASLLSVGLVLVLGRRLVSRPVALLAAALVAVSPLDLWYAQEGRMYAFVAIGSALLWTLLTRPRTQSATAVLIIGIFLIATALMPVPRLYTLKKFALLVWPFVVLLVAWSTARITRWRAQVAWLVLAVSLGASVVNVTAIAKDDWRGLVRYVNANVPHDEPVWLDPAWDAMAYDHYNPARPPASSEPGASLSGSLHSHPAVWLVVQRRLGAAVPGSASEAWLDEHATLTRRVSFARLELGRYQPTP